MSNFLDGISEMRVTTREQKVLLLFRQAPVDIYMRFYSIKLDPVDIPSFTLKAHIAAS